MLRRNMRLMNEQQENFFRRMRHRRMAQSNLTPMGQCRYTGRVLEDSISELNEMVERIGKINLNKDSEPTPNPKPSVSEGSKKTSSGPSSSTKDISNEPAIIETTCTWSMALLVNDGNVFTSVRGVLDSESRHHIISDKCRRKLKLPLMKLNPPPSAETTTKILGKTIVSFSSYFNRKRIFTLEAFVVDKICPRSPSMIVHPGIKRQLDFFKLADPHFDFPGPVELVVGSDLYPILIKGRPCFVLGKSCCVLQSLLGWVVGGKVPIDEFQLNKTRDDTAGKLSRTVKDVEEYVCSTSASAK